ncbi:30S ribosomal protein S17e [Candidatus Woesearchaeota archaeon CG10_big_fil_rev_8_21_14_0_10_44_13]|nr:MAG: 30S ribosomal protein S17e [Candidatus Woesearchaeota archaeon CG10_big_fil_rev_8_21_14_0_10_44_13]
MGRIKTKLTKRITRELVEKHGEQFTSDFDKNKPLIAQYVDFSSKKIRNIVAGYVTRITKKRQQTS